MSVLNAISFPREWTRMHLGAVTTRVVEPGFGTLEPLSVFLGEGVIPRAQRDDNHNQLGADLEKYQRVLPGDLVFNKLRTWQGGFGVSRYTGIVSPAYIIARPTRDVDPQFLHHFMRSDPVLAELARLSKWMPPSQFDIAWEDIRSIEIALPPMEEQRRIADFLDEHVGHIAKIMELRRREVEVLETTRRDALLELIFTGRESTYRSTGIEWLPKIPASWGFVRARFLCDITTGSGDTVDAVDEGEFPFYVRSDRPERSSEFTFDTEAVLTSGDGAGVGKVFHHVVGKFHAHQRVYVLHNFRGVFPRYFFHYFSATFGKVALDGSAKSTVDSVRRDMLAELPVPLPHISAQKAISAEVDDQLLKWREAQQALKESIELLDEYRRSLITAAVTGELDVTTARRGIPA